MQQWDTTLNVTKTSLESQGSAMKEQEKYSQSLEARLNRLSTAGTNLSKTMGDAFISDSIVTFTESISALADKYDGLVKAVGFLPPILGTVGSALIMLSKNFRSGVASVGAYRGAINGLSISLRTLKNSFRTLLASTGVGALFAGVGFAIEKLTGFIGDNIKEQEKLEKETDKLTEKYTDNRKEIEGLGENQEGLIDKYKRLNSITNRSATEQEEYEKVVNRLSEVMPSIVKDKDAEAEKRLYNVDAIEKEVESLKNLSTADANDFIENFDKTVDDIQEKIDNTKNKIEDVKNDSANTPSPYDPIYASTVEFSESDDQIPDPEKRRENLMLSRKEEALTRQMSEAHKDLANKILERDGLTKDLTKTQEKYVQSIIDEEGYTKEARKQIKLYAGHIAELTNKYKNLTSTDSGWIAQQAIEAKKSKDEMDTLASRFSKIKDEFGGSLNIEGINLDKVGNIEEVIQHAKDGINQWDIYKDKLLDADVASENVSNTLGNLRNSESDVAKAAEKVGKDTKNVIPVYNNLGEIIGFTTKNVKNITNEMSKNGKEAKSWSEKISDASGDFEELSNTIAAAASAGKNEEAVSAMQNEAYQTMADEIEPINGLLQDMAKGKEISAAEAMNLINKEEGLADAISIENGQVKVNEDAVLDLRNSKIQSYKDMQQSVLAEAQNNANATLQNLKNYKLQISAIKDLQDAKASMAELEQKESQTYTKNYSDDLVGGVKESLNPLPSLAEKQERQELNKAQEDLQKYVDLKENIDNMQDMVSQGFQEVGTSAEDMSSSTDSASSSTEDNTKELEKAKFVANEYEDQLDKLNYQIERQNELQNKYPDYSDKYKQSLQNEIKLLKQKRDLTKEQMDNVQQQIDSGDITEYGVVSDGTVTVGSSGGSSSSSGRSYSGKYSGIINKASSKHGVDPNLIAAVIKQESRFNPTAGSSAGAQGLMQLMPATAAGLGVSDVHNPYQNIMGGTKYLAQQLDKFNGNIEKALASYNAGPGNVLKYGGIPPFEETQNYVPAVKGYYRSYGGASSGGGSSDNLPDEHPSKAKAENKKAINDAKSDVLDLKSKVLDTNASIDELQDKVTQVAINKVYRKFDQKIDSVNHKLSQEASIMERVEQGTTDYRKSLNTQTELKQEQVKYTQNEINALKNLKQQENLSAKQKDEVNSKIRELSNSYQTLQNDISNLKWNKAENVMTKYQDRLSSLEYTHSRNSDLLGRMSEGTEEYSNKLNEQEDILSKRSDIILNEREALKELIKVEDLGAKNTKKVKEELRSLSLDYQDIQDSLHEVNWEQIQNQMAEYENKLNELEYTHSRNDEIMNRLRQGTEKYSEKLHEQKDLLKERAELVFDERQEILKQMEQQDISKEKYEELRSTLRDLSVDYQNLKSDISDVNSEIIDNTVKQQNQELDSLEYDIERNKSILSRYQDMNENEIDLSDGHDASVLDSYDDAETTIELQERIIQQQKDKAEEIVSNREELKELRKEENLSEKQQEKLNKQLRDMSLSYQDLRESIKSAENELVKNKLDKATAGIEDFNKEIEDTEYKLSLLGENNTEKRSELLDTLKVQAKEADKEIKNSIDSVLKLRAEAFNNGEDLTPYNNRLQDLMNQHQENIKKQRSNYQNMLDVAKKEYDETIEEIDNKLEEHSNDLDEKLSKSEDRIEKYSEEISNLDNDKNFLNDSDFDKRMDLTKEALEENQSKASQLVREFNRLNNTTTYSEQDADSLRQRLSKLKDELKSTNQQTIEYVKNLEQMQFDKVTEKANKAQDEVDRLSQRLNSNMDLLEGGKLSETDLSFDMSMPSGNDLDLSSYREDSVDSLRDIEVELDKSYQRQKENAKERYENRLEQADEYYKDLLESETKFEEKFEKALEEHNSKIEDETERSLDDQYGFFGKFYSNLINLIDSKMKKATDKQKSYLQELKNGLEKIKDFDDEIDNDSSNGDNNNNDGGSAIGGVIGGALGGNAGSIIGSGFGSIVDSFYADGTNGVSEDETAIVGEEGRELIAYPNGKLSLTGDKNAELRNLPKGTGVLPNEETEKFLKSSGVKGYAEGTYGDIYDLEKDLHHISNKDLEEQINVYGNLKEKLKDIPVNEDLANKLDVKTKAEDLDYTVGNVPRVVGHEDNGDEFVKHLSEIKNESDVYFASQDFKDSYLKYLSDMKEKKEVEYGQGSHDPSGGSNNSSFNDAKQDIIEDNYAFQDTYDELQSNVDSARESGNVQDIQDAIRKRDSAVNKNNFQSQSELQQLRYDTAKETRDELRETLSNEDLTDEMQKKYQNAIQEQNQIMNDSMSQRKQIVKDYYDYQQSLRDRDLQEFKDKQDKLDHQLEMSKLQNPDDMSAAVNISKKMVENNKEYTDELKNQRKELKDQLEQYEVGSYEWNIINKQVDETTESIRDAQLETEKLKDQVEDSADDLIGVLKDSIKQQKDLVIESINEQIDELDDKYNRIIDSIDDKESKRDYNKELSDLEEKQADIQHKITIASLNESQEGVARKIELEEELADITEQIEEKKHDRSVELRKESLKEEKEENKEALEEEKEDAKYHYDELLANERKWANVRENIVNGNIDNIESKLKNHLDNFKSYNKETIKEMGLSYQELKNQIDSIIDAQDSLENISNQGFEDDIPSPDNPNNESNKNNNNPSNNQKDENKENKKENEDGIYYKDKYFKNVDELIEYRDNNSTPSNFKDMLKIIHNGEEFSYREYTKAVIADYIEPFKEGGYTGSWGNKGKLAMLHEKELVLNQGDTKNVLESVKAVRDLIPNIKMPSISPQLVGSSGDNYNLTVNVDNLNGTQKEANNIASTVIKSIKKMGK